MPKNSREISGQNESFWHETSPHPWHETSLECGDFFSGVPRKDPSLLGSGAFYSREPISSTQSVLEKLVLNDTNRPNPKLLRVRHLSERYR